MSERTVAAAKAAIVAHTAALRIDDDGDEANIGLWHLIASLLDYAVANGVDLKAMLADVEAERPNF